MAAFLTEEETESEKVWWPAQGYWTPLLGDVWEVFPTSASVFSALNITVSPWGTFAIWPPSLWLVGLWVKGNSSLLRLLPVLSRGLNSSYLEANSYKSSDMLPGSQKPIFGRKELTISLYWVNRSWGVFALLLLNSLGCLGSPSESG